MEALTEFVGDAVIGWERETRDKPAGLLAIAILLLIGVSERWMVPQTTDDEDQP